MAPKRIAVLGGGASSLAAVYGLTSQPGWQQKFDITVYSQGFRLGGKGATGRDAANGDRILEHGLHLWFGFYENAFRMMRQCYQELNRPPSVPIRSWLDAFQPHNQFTMEQSFNGEWHAWNLPLPFNSGTPGDGQPFPDPWDVVIDALQVLYDLWAAYHPQQPGTLSSLVSAFVEAFQKLGGEQLDLLLAPLMTEGAHMLLSAAHQLAKISRSVEKVTGVRGHPVLVKLIRLALDLIRKHLGAAIQTDLLAYRTWIGADAVGTMLIGVLADEVLEKGFDSINHLNFKTWVKKHGASDETLESCLVQSAYDSSFALFRRAKNPDFEAGVVLRGAVRMFLMYKGSVVYRFTAGTGDTVFAPLYELLKARGVKFEFFHRVTAVETLPAGPMEVNRITFDVQATLNQPGYQPLITVKGLPCWPSEPDYAQLVQGAALKAQQVDLESYWSSWVAPEKKELKLGLDFDEVICGLSFEPLKYLAPTLAARHPPLATVLKKLQTTRTQAFQLWMMPKLNDLGWATQSPLLSTFGEPLDTWADLSLTLGAETWPGSAPLSVGYFCGAMTHGADGVPPQSATTYPAEQDALAELEMKTFVQKRLASLWPKAFSGSGSSSTFHWDYLADLNNGVGPARLEAQFWRANVDPSERYVLSVVNTSQYRLRCDRTGFTNLFLVGDYAECGINAGSMEAAIISGLQASRALSGAPNDIPGEGTGLV